MFSVTFWKDAAERALWQVSLTLLALWGADGVFDVFAVDWKQALGVGLGSAVLSLVKSVALAKVGSVDTASLISDITTGRHAKP